MKSKVTAPRRVVAVACVSLMHAILRPALNAGFMGLLPRVALGVLLGLLVRFATAPPSEAVWPTGFFYHDGILTHGHLITMTQYYPEDYCVSMLDPSGSQQEAVDKIRYTFFSDPLSWHHLGGSRVLFHLDSLEWCYPFDPGHHKSIELRFYVEYLGCAGQGPSCLSEWHNPVFNPLTGHYEFRNADVTLNAIHLERECTPSSTNCWQHVINHEVGHTLGLRDPYYQGDCGGGPSVMHNKSYGCTTDYLHPMPADKQLVVSLMPGSAGSGGRGGSHGMGF